MSRKPVRTARRFLTQLSTKEVLLLTLAMFLYVALPVYYIFSLILLFLEVIYTFFWTILWLLGLTVVLHHLNPDRNVRLIDQFWMGLWLVTRWIFQRVDKKVKSLPPPDPPQNSS